MCRWDHSTRRSQSVRNQLSCINILLTHHQTEQEGDTTEEREEGSDDGRLQGNAVDCTAAGLPSVTQTAGLTGKETFYLLILRCWLASGLVGLARWLWDISRDGGQSLLSCYLPPPPAPSICLCQASTATLPAAHCQATSVCQSATLSHYNNSKLHPIMKYRNFWIRKTLK